MPADAFCMNCFAPMAAAEAACPDCGASTAELGAREYRDKLLHALDHPLAEVRMRAVHALRLRVEIDAADALARCAMNHPVDVIQGLLIVGALHAMAASEPGRNALRLLAGAHAAHAVREAARVVLVHAGAADQSAARKPSEWAER
jgi:predicted amidophosphoribosyltransferase